MAARYCRRAGIESAVDIGCGKGFLVERLISYGIKARGFDVSSYALSFAAELPCELLSATEVDFKENEAVILLGVLMYLSYEELSFFLKRVVEARPKFLVISVFSSEMKERSPDINRKILENRAWWSERLGQAGLRPVACNRSFSVWVPVGNT